MTSRRTEEVPLHDDASSFSVSVSAGSTPDTDPASARASAADRVTIVEVGPRDGLQNEKPPIPTSAKIAFVDALSLSGLPVIEVTSFVNPRAVPQLADAAEVMLGITRAPDVVYLTLVPNERGLQRAIDAGVKAIALFSAASEEFAHANVGTSIAGTFDRFLPVVASARERGIWIRGYVSVAFGCPYAGEVDPAAAANVAESLLTLGCDEICLADTIGVATPTSVRSAVSAALAAIPVDRLALHFHDTNGLALDNVVAGLDLGVRIFDAAAGGLGGCPFAPGAPGNVSTQSLIDRLHGLGLQTGVDRDQVEYAVELIRPYVPRLQTATA